MKAVTEEMIPINPMSAEPDSVPPNSLKVTVDRNNAICFIQERWGSEKIVIIFEKPHQEWGEFFTTKYFLFEEPGKMQWGHDGNYMKLELIEN